MGEIKTKPTAASVPDFLLAAQPARRVEEGQLICRLMEEVSGLSPVMWGPTMVGFGSYHYVSPASNGAEGDWPKFGFSPRKGAISLYGLKDLPAGAELLPSLGKYTEGAGCVYVKKLTDIDLDVLRQLVGIAAARGDDPPRAR